MADATLDILGRKQQAIGLAYSSDSFQIAIGNNADDAFLLIQNMSFNYAQNVTRLFDLERAEFQAYVASRPQGQMTLANVVTNIDKMINFLQKYGDVCSADKDKNITISVNRRSDAASGICSQETGSISFSHPVLISTAVSIAVADYIVSNNMAFIFASAKSAGTSAQIN